MLKLKMTGRDKILLILFIIILIAAAYYWLYYTPAMDRLTQLDLDIEDKKIEITTAQMRLGQMNAMKAELDEIFAAADGDPTEICEYNNINNVLNELQLIFFGLDFEMKLSDPLFDSGSTIVRRNISVSFDTDSFTDAYSMLEALHNSVYRCLIKDLSMRNGGKSGEDSFSISADITYFEYNAAE